MASNETQTSQLVKMTFALAVPRQLCDKLLPEAAPVAIL